MIKQLISPHQVSLTQILTRVAHGQNSHGSQSQPSNTHTHTQLYNNLNTPTHTLLHSSTGTHVSDAHTCLKTHDTIQHRGHKFGQINSSCTVKFSHTPDKHHLDYSKTHNYLPVSDRKKVNA